MTYFSLPKYEFSCWKQGEWIELEWLKLAWESMEDFGFWIFDTNQVLYFAEKYKLISYLMLSFFSLHSNTRKNKISWKFYLVCFKTPWEQGCWMVSPKNPFVVVSLLWKLRCETGNFFEYYISSVFERKNFVDKKVSFQNSSPQRVNYSKIFFCLFF